ncbi:MAG: hypothetical protein WCO56_27245 [Verrucomicrobiota bacterium]
MSFIDEVRAKRQKLADVLADEEYSGIREIVEELYPDRAHFIYELLQNSEDAGATEVTFALGESAVSFEHNGRPFDKDDVLGITNIGKGTKKDQPDQIGRFGVGFKAVFAYSETPHIWSPNVSFSICDLVLPTEIAPKPDLLHKTRFDFPFNNPKKSSPVAYAEVKAGLEGLAETTLLFLSHLKAIRWQINPTLSGEVLRVHHSANHIEVLKRANGESIASSHFLRFSQPVQGLEKQFVSVAFALASLPHVTIFNAQQPIAEQFKIIPATTGRVAVFFPADKETSGLRFHLHAPFVPELSRASVKDTPANAPLFAQLAQLAAGSLHIVRQLDLLTGEFLAVLPNPQDPLPPRYQPIRTAIINEMNNQPLTPTYSKSHAPAKNLRQAKASLKELLSSGDLAFLSGQGGQPLNWAIAAAQKNSNADRFLAGLAITGWGIDKFIECLTQKASVASQSTFAYSFIRSGPDPAFMKWLSEKSMEWHQGLYGLLFDHLAADPDQLEIHFEKLKNLQIARLSNASYSLGSKCFFPDNDMQHDEVLPRVDVRLYTSGNNNKQQEAAHKFLKVIIGVREVGEAERIEAVLRERYGAASLKPDRNDLARWIALVEKDPEKAAIFKPYCIFERKDGKWTQPKHVFLDDPFEHTELSVYYNAYKLGEPSESNGLPMALADYYQDCGVTIGRLVAFAKAVGVQTYLSSVDELLNILPHIEKSIQLGTPDIVAITFLWRILCEQGRSNSHILEVPYSHHKGWGHHETRYYFSKLCSRLQSSSWVPQQIGMDLKFLPPRKASREALPAGFPFDSGWRWLQHFEFGADAAKISEDHRQQEAMASQQETMAKQVGFPDAQSLERAKRFASLPAEEQERYLAEREKRSSGNLPDHEPVNADRRAERVGEGAADAPERVTEKRIRSVAVGREDVKEETEEYLRHQYTNEDGEMICQVCQAPLPFKLDDGSYYFEKVEFLDLVKRHYQNYLALCPNHSAMFQYANGSRTQLRGLFAAMEGQNLAVVLAGTNFTTYFTKTHIADLKKVIEVDSNNGSLPAT